MMINMFWFSFVLILFIGHGVNGQLENLSMFGQLHQLIDNQKSPPISCVRVRPNIKNVYPTDNTKYFVCRDEQRYEISTCPNGGIFDNNEKACIDLCEQKKPCLNQGQCIILSNLTLQCVCRRDWTGEQCEIPLSTCATNPCGPNGECRMLKTNDYPQDYVCICNNQKSYGRNCQHTVPNPCLMNLQQFHPFAYSRQAYINCDDELIFFQPCNAKLYWNQEDKRCDRSLPALFKSPFSTLKNRLPQKPQIQSNPVQSTQWQSTQNNQQSLTNTFLETTTGVPRIFHLKGFSNKNSGQQNTLWQNNPNIQSMVQPQSWQSTSNNQQFQNLNGQSADLMTSFNSQNFAVQPQSDQLTTSFETTTVPNKDVQQGIFMQTLRGWRPSQQGSLNQIDQQKLLGSIPTFQTSSWKG